MSIGFDTFFQTFIVILQYRLYHYHNGHSVYLYCTAASADGVGDADGAVSACYGRVGGGGSSGRGTASGASWRLLRALLAVSSRLQIVVN